VGAVGPEDHLDLAALAASRGRLGLSALAVRFTDVGPSVPAVVLVHCGLSRLAVFLAHDSALSIAPAYSSRDLDSAEIYEISKV
jgi:hypothetical protein